MNRPLFTNSDVLLLPSQRSAGTSGDRQAFQLYSDDHPGNRRLIHLLEQYKDSYQTALISEDFASCDHIGITIVTTICENFKGKFLEHRLSSNSWEDIGRMRAVEVVKLALQDSRLTQKMPSRHSNTTSFAHSSNERSNHLTEAEMFGAQLLQSHSDGKDSHHGEAGNMNEGHAYPKDDGLDHYDTFDPNLYFESTSRGENEHRQNDSGGAMQYNFSPVRNRMDMPQQFDSTQLSQGHLDEHKLSLPLENVSEVHCNNGNENHLSQANIVANSNLLEAESNGHIPQAFTSVIPRDLSAFQPRPSCFDTASSNYTGDGTESNASAASSMHSSLRGSTNSASMYYGNDNVYGSSDRMKSGSKSRSSRVSRKKKTNLRRRGMITSNLHTSSSSTVNLRDDRYKIDPNLSRLANSAARSVASAASESTTDDLSEFRGLSTVSNADSEQSESKRRRHSKTSSIKGLMSNLHVGKSKHNNSPEADLIERGGKVKLLDGTTLRDINKFDVICQLKENDCLLEGSYIGNNRVKLLLNEKRDALLSKQTPSIDKEIILKTIVREIGQGKGNGAFIALSDDENNFYELDTVRACMVLTSVLDESRHDPRVFNLPAMQYDATSVDVQNQTPSLAQAELQNMKRKKGKKVLSTNLGHSEIEQLQFKMRNVGSYK